MKLERRKFLGAVGGIAGASVFGGQVSAAVDDEDDSGYDPEFLENDDLLDNEELAHLLKSIEEDGTEVSVSEIGESTQGRPIWAAAVGSGSTDVMAIAQQHGDELLTPEGTIAALQYLATTDSEAVREVRDELTLHLVPRMNPDGFVARQRYNVDTDAPARAGADIFGADIGIFAADLPFVGWDVNRYHWAPDWTESDLYGSYPEKFPENPVKEVQVVYDGIVDEVDPDWIIDYHRQGEYVVDEDRKFDPEVYPEEELDEPEPYPPDPDDAGGGDVVTSSLFWPINEDVPEDARDLSKQLVYTMYDELTTDSEANVTWYPGGTYAGIARNGHGLQGRGSVLFELSAGTLGDRQFRVEHVAESLLAVTKATADGSLSDIDPSNVQEIPGRGSDFTVESAGGESRPE